MDKFRIFKKLFRYPVKTNEITSIINDKFTRIFDGRNPVFNYQFMNTSMRDHWEWYRQEVLSEPTVWQTTAWEYFKTEPNCVLIVDLPQEQTGRIPEPYFYWLPIERVVNYELSEHDNAQMDWIIFSLDDNRIAVFDDKYYRVFDRMNLITPIVEREHEIGYCPARFFNNVPLDITKPDLKWSPLTKELESLDEYLFKYISNKHLSLYAAFPVYVGYKQDCRFSNERGERCDGGHLRSREGHYMMDKAGGLIECPNCGDKRLRGAGSFVEMDIPKAGQSPLTDPLRLIGADVATLEFNRNALKEDREQIITSVVGTDENIITSQALNELQVESSFENSTTILSRIKKIFEDAQQWADETCCRLMFGNGFISAYVNYGTDFFVLSVEKLREQYLNAKNAGASESELDAINRQILETQYRNNPTELQRMIILAELEPFRHLTRTEVLNLFNQELITEEELRIKLDFSSFVRRFEREEANILEFGTAIPFAEKIRIITETFKNYARERIATNTTSRSGTTENQNTPA